MKRFSGFLLIFTAAFATAAIAAPAGQRVRGSIKSVNNRSLVIQSRQGKTVKLRLNSKTKYLSVVKSSLAKVDKQTYIGTATKKQGKSLVALEVVIFPKSMRGTGEGHYAWDKLSDTTQSGGGAVSSMMTNGNVAHASTSGGKSQVQSTMTNGNVTTTAKSSGSKPVQSTMTNGNVEAAHNRAGAKQITVTYKGGQEHIMVPPSAPIVAFQKADRSAIKPAAKVFIIAAGRQGALTAKLVAVGKDGLKPPM